MTRCSVCGFESSEEDYDICPGCNHATCENCQVSGRRGRCLCKNSVDGIAFWDQPSEDSRDAARINYEYRGQFKPILQVRMEMDLCGNEAWGDPPKARVGECGYFLCNAPAEGWSQEHPPSRTKLTDGTLDAFVLCQLCRSMAYCSAACRNADAMTPTRNMWDAQQLTHTQRCGEAYCEFPPVSLYLRKYKQRFGRNPHPLGLNSSFDSSS